MWQDDKCAQFNFKFSQCNLLDETSDASSTCRIKNKTKDQSSSQKEIQSKDTQTQEQQLARPIDILEENLRDMTIYEEKLSAFCGLWEDYPRKYYRMEFRIEMGQLVGYSNIDSGKALASYDGNLINMIIVHSKESGRSLDHYRGQLGWNQKYIRWEKEDSSRENGWRSTRRWIKIE